ncbi:lipopolysaccharide assembly protein LapA domain-containing protein [Aureimonas populi]|uniref:Lipopolysaccharide assembly protein LapA domain-containing protein n=1 Tax=Aureimonas populi TaxID=1701758 RepID=A0ABW5CPS3_9HYPH|nr:lipopolysaccharide assembly protein LapA domain-containing protein [Aureimonas populi]
MISRLLTLIVLVPLAVLLVVFCVLNRTSVTVSMDALGTMPNLAFDAPLFVVMMGALILGVLLGGVGTWFTQSHYRARAARRAREVQKLRHEVDSSNERLRRLREERERERAASTGLAGPQGQGALAPPA